MVETTRHLVEQINAKIGYTQSDEINLILYYDKSEQTPLFGGKFQKIVSILSSMCTAEFNRLVSILWTHKREDTQATFDCRAWTVPDKVEAANNILWREFDAIKNSVSSAARYYYSHKQLISKNTDEKREMLHKKDIDWECYPVGFKRGIYVQRRKEHRTLTNEEYLRIPFKHRPSRNQPIERTITEEIIMPQFSKVINRVGVIFDGEKPKI